MKFVQRVKIERGRGVSLRGQCRVMDATSAHVFYTPRDEGRREKSSVSQREREREGGRDCVYV